MPAPTQNRRRHAPCTRRGITLTKVKVVMPRPIGRRPDSPPGQIRTVPARRGLREKNSPPKIRSIFACPVTALDSHVLVLNRLWQPVNTCTARRAITLVFLGHAHIVHRDTEDNYSTHDAVSWLSVARQDHRQQAQPRLRTTQHEFIVPEIIVLAIYDRLPRTEVKLTRHNVFLRDRFTCQYCDRLFAPRDLNLDHVIPRDKGGKATWENLVASCLRCNSKKANKLPHEARMFPRTAPKAPRWRPFHTTLRHDPPRTSWRAFIESADGKVEISA